jgi:hypothetical protein
MNLETGMRLHNRTLGKQAKKIPGQIIYGMLYPHF